jgi:hypothetical protein
MKRITQLALLSLTILLFGCNLETIEQSEDQIFEENLVTHNVTSFSVLESDNSSDADLEDHCHTVSLVAGQHHEAGTVTIDLYEDVLKVTYNTTGDWVLDATHLHITNCDEEAFPMTGANNPKIGHFDYASEHEAGTTQVVYTIELSEITDELCFAVHAEVNGPSSETAWAKGEDFGGKSWAMFFRANLTDCNDDDEYVGGRG